MPIDPQIVGVWERPGTKIRIDEDEWLYILDERPFYISADGSTLTVGPTDYTRLYGSGQTIVGVWSTTSIEPDGVWVEEVHYRDDGTLSGFWTHDGAFDINFFSYYSARGGILRRDERRALLTTSAGAITLDYPYDHDEAGTYEVTANGHFVMVINGVTFDYAPVLNFGVAGMPDAKAAMEPISELSLIGSDGVRVRVAPAAPMPGDLVPGEFVYMPYGTGSQWFLFSNKQRLWDGAAWRVTGSIQAFDPSTMTEDELYELRRSTLSREGWTG